MTDYHPKHGFLPWAADRARDDGLFHVAALIRSAMVRIEGLEAERDRLQSCTGCERAPTDTKPHYDSDCMECCRFYGDLYEETNE